MYVYEPLELVRGPIGLIPRCCSFLAKILLKTVPVHNVPLTHTNLQVVLFVLLCLHITTLVFISQTVSTSQTT